MPKLLLADDSPTTQKVVQLTFADEGIDVVVADDGDTALEMFDHHHPDIVLADINIPGLNGYEVCEAIRKRSGNGSTPVILLAGSFEPFDVQQAHRVGANDYLTKPFASIRRLVATVTALLDAAVRSDNAAEETVEPSSIPPDSDEERSGSVGLAPHQPPTHEPGPALPPEPDMRSTDDIENLIQQSFVETIEMPHTVAERIINETTLPKTEDEEPQLETSRDEMAFDDDLIETTSFDNGSKASVEPDSSVPSEPENGEAAEQYIEPPELVGEGSDLSSSNGYFRTETPTDFSAEPQSEERSSPGVGSENSEDGSYASGSDNVDTSEQSRVPTAEFHIDQSEDETYFEPAAEHEEVHDDFAQRSTEQQSDQIESRGEEHTGFEIVSSQEPVPEYSSYDAPERSDAAESHSVEDDIGGTTFTSDETEQPIDNVAGSTPWDSVAQPVPHPFQMDESNLLELPHSYGSSSPEPKVDANNEVSKTAAELAPAIVDEIARVTASQISEELVREIAQRIVPKVVEEVIARHKNENDEQ